MSIVPISWTELDSYCRRSRTDLSAWESDKVIMMSREYCSFIEKAKSERCIQPYWPDMSESERKKYNESISKIGLD